MSLNSGAEDKGTGSCFSHFAIGPNHRGTMLQPANSELQTQANVFWETDDGGEEGGEEKRNLRKGGIQSSFPLQV